MLIVGTLCTHWPGHAMTAAAVAAAAATSGGDDHDDDDGKWRERIINSGSCNGC